MVLFVWGRSISILGFPLAFLILMVLCSDPLHQIAFPLQLLIAASKLAQRCGVDLREERAAAAVARSKWPRRAANSLSVSLIARHRLGCFTERRTGAER
jgi:hypothetical protein